MSKIGGVGGSSSKAISARRVSLRSDSMKKKRSCSPKKAMQKVCAARQKRKSRSSSSSNDGPIIESDKSDASLAGPADDILTTTPPPSEVDGVQSHPPEITNSGEKPAMLTATARTSPNEPRHMQGIDMFDLPSFNVSDSFADILLNNDLQTLPILEDSINKQEQMQQQQQQQQQPHQQCLPRQQQQQQTTLNVLPTFPECLTNLSCFENLIGYVCLKCDIKFSNEGEMWNHMMYVHSKQIITTCKLCGVVFNDMSQYFDHFKYHIPSNA